jgi:hypothetical protein
MANELFVLVTNTHLEMDSNLTGILWWSHRDSHSVEHIEFLLYEVSVLPAAKHVIMHHVKSFSFFHEFGGHSHKTATLFRIVIDGNFTLTTIFGRVRL